MENRYGWAKARQEKVVWGRLGVVGGRRPPATVTDSRHEGLQETFHRGLVERPGVGEVVDDTEEVRRGPGEP